MPNRKPNAGPYEVSWTARVQKQKYQGFGKYGAMEWVNQTQSVECHTWTDACRKMRELLIAGYNDVQVSYC